MRSARTGLQALVLIAGMAMMTSHAAASSLTLQFDGLHFGSNSLTVRSNVTGQQTYYAGVLRWYEQGDRANQFLTICTEVTQTVLATSEFTLTDLKNAPQPGAGMGSYRAGLIQDLFNKHWHAATASRTESAAFQLAVWELAYEDGIYEGGSYNLDVSVGDFRITGGSVTKTHDGLGHTAVQLANAWLNALTSVDVTNLMALSHQSGQDQIITVIPLPPAFAMAGLGFLVAGLVRRRMTAAS